MSAGTLLLSLLQEKSSVEVSKQGKGVIKPKKFRSFKRFKQDLSPVCRGRHTDNLQYIMEVDNRDELIATYLLATYGEFTEGHSDAQVAMMENGNVMDLWARYSGEGHMNESAEDQLKELNDII